MSNYNITITNQQTNETIEVGRSVTTTHPEWVHRQLDTSSEAELQQHLDACNVEDWYCDGKHLGPDVSGLSMVRREVDGYTAEEIALAQNLAKLADEGGTIQAGDMQSIAPHDRPELHATMGLAAAFRALTGKAWDAEALS